MEGMQLVGEQPELQRPALGWLMGGLLCIHTLSMTGQEMGVAGHWSRLLGAQATCLIPNPNYTNFH